METTSAKMILELFRLTSFYSALENFVAFMENSRALVNRTIVLQRDGYWKLGKMVRRWRFYTFRGAPWMGSVACAVSASRTACPEDCSTGMEIGLQPPSCTKASAGHTVDNFACHNIHVPKQKMHCLDTKWQINSNKQGVHKTHFEKLFTSRHDELQSGVRLRAWRLRSLLPYCWRSKPWKVESLSCAWHHTLEFKWISKHPSIYRFY